MIKNNKGFTLIELLGVIVVLVLILLIAIPSITSTYERNKKKINEQKIDVILSAAEIYANRYKKEMKEYEEYTYEDFLNGGCGILVSTLLYKDLITYDEILDSSGNYLTVNVDGEDYYVDDEIAGDEYVVIIYNEGVFEFAYEVECY